jgi:hypothetical protein
LSRWKESVILQSHNACGTAVHLALSGISDAAALHGHLRHSLAEVPMNRCHRLDHGNWRCVAISRRRLDWEALAMLIALYFKEQCEMKNRDQVIRMMTATAMAIPVAGGVPLDPTANRALSELIGKSLINISAVGGQYSDRDVDKAVDATAILLGQTMSLAQSRNLTRISASTLKEALTYVCPLWPFCI